MPGVYKRLLAAKKKAEQAREIQLLREQVGQGWPPTFTLSLHPMDADSAHSGAAPMSIREQSMRREPYLNTTKPRCL